MSEAELAVRAAGRAPDALAARPKGDVDDPEMWPAYRQIWPHLRRRRRRSFRREQVRDLLVDRVRYLRQRDDLEPGRRRAEEIEDAWIAMLAGGRARQTNVLRQQLYRLQFNLANILRDLGRFEEARTLDEAVLRGQEALLGTDHPHTLQTRSSLAARPARARRVPEALELDRETYESWALQQRIRRRLRGHARGGEQPRPVLPADRGFPGRPAVGTGRPSNGGLSLYARPGTRGRWNRDPPSAATCSRLGRYREAVRMMPEVAAQSHDSLGDDARITLNARLWLGIAQRCVG